MGPRHVSYREDFLLILQLPIKYTTVHHEQNTKKIKSYIDPHPSPPGCILPLSHASVLHHAVAACASLAAFQTAFLLPLTPSLSLSSTGTVISHEIQASVTDWPHLRPARPEGGMSCRPSTRLDSSMTPMIMEEVSADSSCCAYLEKRRGLKKDAEREDRRDVRYPRRRRSGGGAASSCCRDCSRSGIA